MNIKFGSVCSGIEAASVAWLPLGWRCEFVSEIEPFPNAVLKHHYPETPNLGDITKYEKWNRAAVDVLIGGTPCQSFSIAGLRAGLADPRGNLTLTFLGIVKQHRPTWVVWENVPGVLSDKTGAFGTFLTGLGKLGYGFAWRILDAQYFGVAQRRRRVFVVGHIGGLWQRAAAVLFDASCLLGNPSPRRETRERPAPTISGRTKGGGGLGTDAECDRTVIPIQEIGKRQSGNSMNGVGHGKPGDPMYTLQKSALHGVAIGFDSKQGGDTQLGATEEKMPPLKGQARHAVAFHENQRGEVSESETAGSLKLGGGKPGQGYPAVAVGIAGGETGFPLRSSASHSGDKVDGGINTSMVVAPCLTKNYGKQPDNSDTNAGPALITHSLKADGFDASEDGTGRGTPLVPEVCGTLSDGAHMGGGTNGQDAYTGRIIPATSGLRDNSTGQQGVGQRHEKGASDSDASRRFL
jgi:DNA (cytosine-5)-methyltransferase 1